MVDFAKAMKDAEKAGLLSSGDIYKLKEGANRFRLMTACLPHEGEFKGARNFKWLCYVLDRVDQKIKPFFMAHTIYKDITALQTSEDYAFKDVPMPYDLTVNAAGAGTKEVKYSTVPARHEKPLTVDEIELFKATKPLEDAQKGFYEKAAKTKTSAAPPSDDDFPPHTDDDN